MDETLLTAYALGELSGTERAAVAAYLAGSPEARHYVAEIRLTANLLVDELARESFGGLTELQHIAIEQKLDTAGQVPAYRLRIRRRKRWDRAVFVMSLAASVLIVCGVLGVLWPFVYRHVYNQLQMSQSGSSNPSSNPNSNTNTNTDSNTNRSSNPGVQPSNLASGTPGSGSQLPPGVEGPVQARPEHSADSAVAGNQNTVPDEPWAIPDMHLIGTERNPEEMSVPVIVGVRPQNNPLPKPAPQLTHAEDHGHGATVSPALVPRLRDNAESFVGPNQHVAGSNHLIENSFVDTAVEPMSGFSAGVDTASYSNIRRYLNHGKLPPPDAVRIEEMLNYFPVRSSPSTSASSAQGALGVQVEVGACPWEPKRRLARVCLQASELPPTVRPQVNLVFVVDVSDAMRADKSKLALIKLAMKSIVGKLSSRDRFTIVSYAQEAITVLPPTAGDDRQTILMAIDRLEFIGHSAGGQGIEVAYEQAARAFIPGGVNRVIIATDGNWNVGVTEKAQLPAIVHDQTRSNISLTVLGVGMNNLKDAELQKLAIAGNGSYAYIDTVDEARKVLSDQVSGALVAVARNVKVQITFNPAVASSYRLIGYERRILGKDELHSDSAPGGEMGAGQSVTALYEVIPAAKSPTTRPVEMLTATVTYSEPASKKPHTLTVGAEDHATPVPRTSAEFRFSAAVAEFGLLLRDSDWKGNATWTSLLERAQDVVGLETGYRQEFLKLIRAAKALHPGR